MLQQLVVAAKPGLHIVAQRGKILGGCAAKAFENSFEKAAQHQKLLGQAVAQPKPRAIRKDQGRDGEGHHDTQNHLADAIHCQAPARAFLVNQHDDGDGDSGKP